MNAKLKPTIVEETAAKRSHILQSTQNQERGGGGDKGALGIRDEQGLGTCIPDFLFTALW